MEARLRHSVDEGEWSAVARGYAGDELPGMVSDAREALAAGRPLAEVVDTLTEELRSRTEDHLFAHVKRTGMMDCKTRLRYCPTLPGYRRYRYPLTRSEVPDALLDVPALIPDLREMVAAALTAGSPSESGK